MLPDIDQHNTRRAVSGLGMASGCGILTRSATDMHPEEFVAVVVWNGTIDAEHQKAEQRPAPAPHTLTMTQRAELYARSLTAILREAGEALSLGQIAAKSSLHRDTVDVFLRKMANRGELSVCDEVRHVGLTGAKRMVRVYSLPKVTKEQAA